MVASQPTDAELVIEFCERFLVIPEGAHVGQPVQLRDWQKDIIREIYDNPAGTRRAIISFGRKNGKTAITAMLLLVHLVGPMAARTRGSEICSAAQSRDQAAIVFRYAAKMVRASGELNRLVRVRDSSKTLTCERFQTAYNALSAEADTAFGRSDVLVIHDELGRVKGPRSDLYEALETGQSAHAHPLSIIISTQAPNDADLLSILIDDAEAGHDPRTVLSLHTASEDLDPFSEEAIRAANPAFGDFQNAEEIRATAEDARRMPAREAEYRNLILNQRVEASNPFVTQSVWMQNADEPDVPGPVYGGLDLSETNDLTALVLVSPMRGQFHIRPTFWLPQEGLEERARKDRVPYDVWAREGLLHTTPGRSVQYEYVAERIATLFERHEVRTIAFDRYNMRHLRPWLVKAGLSETLIDERFHEFGQGYVSMSPALRSLESFLLDGKLRHGSHPALTMCAANAVVKMDEAGNRKLDKKQSRGRIDGMVALAMATAMAAEDLHGQPVYPVSVDSILEDITA